MASGNDAQALLPPRGSCCSVSAAESEQHSLSSTAECSRRLYRRVPGRCAVGI